MSSGLIKSTLKKYKVYLILYLELNHGVKINDNKSTLRNGVLLLRFCWQVLRLLWLLERVVIVLCLQLLSHKGIITVLEGTQRIRIIKFPVYVYTDLWYFLHIQLFDNLHTKYIKQLKFSSMWQCFIRLVEFESDSEPC